MINKKSIGHTPGPWEPCYHWRHPNCPCGTHRGYVWDSTGDRVIAQMGCDRSDGEQVYDEPGKQEARANAHLIAAAPDLLAACKAALGAFEFNHCINWDDLRRAIEKAEGNADG